MNSPRSTEHTEQTTLYFKAKPICACGISYICSKEPRNESSTSYLGKVKPNLDINLRNFCQTQKVRFLGFRKFQVFSPNRGDAQLFRKTVENNQVRLRCKLISIRV